MLLNRRSLDGIQFEPIQTVSIKGWNDGTKKYKYEDVGILKTNATVFYRLKIVAADGSFKYSNVNKITMGKAQTGNLVVYPNPVKSIANISYFLAEDSNVQCQVYDISGRVVYSDIFNGLKGDNTILYNFNQLNKGQYLLKLYGGGVEDSYRFIKE